MSFRIRNHCKTHVNSIVFAQENIFTAIRDSNLDYLINIPKSKLQDELFKRNKLGQHSLIVCCDPIKDPPINITILKWLLDNCQNKSEYINVKDKLNKNAMMYIEELNDINAKKIIKDYLNKK